MPPLDLRAAWSALLARRTRLRDALSPYGEIVELWARVTPPAPLALSAEVCRRHWKRGESLLSAIEVPLSREQVAEVLGPVLDVVGGVRVDASAALSAFAGAWDRGDVGADALLPERGRIGRGEGRHDVQDTVLGSLAIGGLRPLLEPLFTTCRPHLAPDDWDLGVCPFCGAPPGWGDVEGGRLALACHVCGGSWIFRRNRCPFCGTEDAKARRRLAAGSGEEGYAIVACESCRAYVKEIDRRERGNGGPAVLEDWASPHLDLAVMRQGFWRPLVPLIVSIPA
jgi:FdhE protein